MNRQIVFYKENFLEFHKNRDSKVKDKIQYVFELIKKVDRIPEKFLSPTSGFA